MKLGSIKISSQLIELSKKGDNRLSVLFTKFFPLKIEHDLNESIYTGVCNDFRDLEECEAIPFYEFIINENNKTIKLIMKPKVDKDHIKKLDKKKKKALKEGKIIYKNNAMKINTDDLHLMNENI